MLLCSPWLVAEPEPPEQRPAKADHHQDDKGQMPAELVDQPGHAGHRQRCPDTRSGKIDAFDKPAFPAPGSRNTPRAPCRESAGLAGAEQKTNHEQAHKAPRRSSQPGKHDQAVLPRSAQRAPPKRSAMAPPGFETARNRKRTKPTPTTIALAQAQVASDRVLGRGDAGAVHVEQNGKQKRAVISRKRRGIMPADVPVAPPHSSPSTAKARQGQPSPPAILSGNAAKNTLGPSSWSRLHSPSTIITPPPSRILWMRVTSARLFTSATDGGSTPSNFTCFPRTSAPGRR